MSRLIDIDDPRNCYIGMDGEYETYNIDPNVIAEASSVQPDIIHCKDCKHWMPYDWMFSEVWLSKNIDDYPEDEIGCTYCDMNMGANDFCSRPERRTDD